MRRLPFNKIINNFGNQLSSMCFYCSNPMCESIQHVFIEGQPANHIWNFFGASLDIRHHHWSPTMVLKKWRDTRPKNEIHKLLLQIIPICIFWEIWRSWAACKYGEQRKFVTARMEVQIQWTINAALSIAFPKLKTTGTWAQQCRTIEQLKPVVV